MQTKADKIRSALKANPKAKVVDIAKVIGVDPQEIYMVRYNDKKRARLKARKARAKKAMADFDAFNKITYKIPTIKEVVKPTKQTLVKPEVSDELHYLVALNRASSNAERAVKETAQLREILEKQDTMHPLAIIILSVVMAVLISFVLGGIV